MDESITNQSIVQVESVQGEIIAKEVHKDCYAIIGTRNPDAAQEEIAYHLAWAIAVLGGKIVRTGADYGINKQAMDGTNGHNLEVYLPYSSYNRNIIPTTASIRVYNPNTDTAWTDSINRYHPSPNRLSSTDIALHAKDFGIIDGCKGVIALPQEDGEGYTGQGIRLARALNIQLILGIKGQIEDAPRFIGKVLQKLGLVSSDLRSTILGEY